MIGKAPLGIAVLAAFVVTLAFFDRVPPYVRESGSIVSAPPESCGLPDDAPQGAVAPGSCVEVKWKVTPIRECAAAGRFNVQRFLIDSQGVRHPLPSADSEFRAETGPTLNRFFALPMTTPLGRSTYDASACFACNPTQYLKPVCVERPSIVFDVKRPTN